MRIIFIQFYFCLMLVERYFGQLKQITVISMWAVRRGSWCRVHYVNINVTMIIFCLRHLAAAVIAILYSLRPPLSSPRTTPQLTTNLWQSFHYET